MYIQKSLTLRYTTQALNLFNSHSFSNVGLTHCFFLLKILRIRLVDCNRNFNVIAIPMVQLYSCLVMFLLFVIIISYESLFLKMRNRHSLLKVLNPYSLTKCNTLCLSIIPKIPKIPLYPPSPKISFFLL